jgi:methionyl-tRNA formyltransferase
MRIVILAPIHNSLYSRLVAWQLSQEQDIQIEGILVRSHWNFGRLQSEFRRDGPRLIKKISRKMVLGDNRFLISSDSLKQIQDRTKLPGRSLKDISSLLAIKLVQVSDFNDQRCIHYLKQVKPDLILFTGGGLLRQEILKVPSIGILNCHAGILPYFRGMDVVEWTAVEGCIPSVGIGVSLHLMDAGVDTGPILFTQRLELMPNDSFESIRERIDAMMVAAMVKGVCGLRDGEIIANAQQVEKGKQYYIMHPRLKAYADRKLKEQLPR